MFVCCLDNLYRPANANTSRAWQPSFGQKLLNSSENRPLIGSAMYAQFQVTVPSMPITAPASLIPVRAIWHRDLPTDRAL